MKIEGMQKLTLLDFPGRVAATVFTPGCDMRCPFCHNAELVVGGQGGESDPYMGQGALGEEPVFELLEKRRGVLTGLAITGGEPLMQADIADFIRRVKDMGYAVKLDTNGSFPARLKQLVGGGLVDYVAVDVKNCREKYAETAGLSGEAAERMLPMVYESIEYLMEGHVDFEFRTTVVKELHEDDDFRRIGEWLRGDEKFFLQSFSDSGSTIMPGLHKHEKADMERFAAIMREFVPNTELRGI
jgi:pyruvate formate lyase activating enzyme